MDPGGLADYDRGTPSPPSTGAVSPALIMCTLDQKLQFHVDTIVSHGINVGVISVRSTRWFWSLDPPGR